MIKFVKIAAVVAMAATSLAITACETAPEPAPPPVSMGMSK